MLRPDMLALQSVTANFIARLQERVCFEHYDVQLGLCGLSGCAILTDTAVFDCQRSHAAPKNAAGASVGVVGVYMDKETKQEIAVLNVKLDRALDKVASPQLQEAINALTTEAGFRRPTIVCGDFQTQTAQMKPLCKSLAKHSMRRVPTAPTVPTVEIEGQNLTLDHLYCSESVRGIGGASVLPDGHRHRSRKPPYHDSWPSDHFLILQDLSVGEDPLASDRGLKNRRCSAESIESSPVRSEPQDKDFIHVPQETV